MAKVIFGNHSSVLVPRQDRDRIRRFYCDVLGGRITKADPERDFVRLGDNFYIGFLYGDVTDESEFLRSFRAIWLELKSDNVDEVSRRILASGLVRKLEVPDPHLYFQAPGGQCLRLVGIDENLSFYEGAGDGPDVAKVKEAIRKEAMKK
jgi:catechol 2,3-dioxygenase-like lactoylglutathione lyase family enzyme